MAIPAVSGGKPFMGSREADRNHEVSNSSSDISHAIQTQISQQPGLDPGYQTVQEKLEEQRKIRRLQMMMNMVTSVISQDESLTVEQAAELVADSKKAALAMFPDKELAYNLIYKPRLQRLMRERFRIQ
jgi:hypothetical protein